ncbi:PRC and DUF2382 domain-containing protein [Modestobacter roseus]|uniref:PRC and DUF2382 domain-containing protein n=1 Tax=Modestobacter roseus TaxID=1181884 RepID=UPI0034DF9149
MTTDSAPPPVIGATVDDRDGTALGTVTAVFLDDVTGRPTWIGLTEGQHAAPDDEEVPVIAPMAGAEFDGGRLHLTVPATAVRTAPRVARPDHLSPDEEATLQAHYRVGAAAGTGPEPAHSRTAPVPTTRDGAGDGTMTRSEEQLEVHTVVEPWTRAVLRIEEVTEEVMVPVTVTRQRARIEHLPLRAGVGADGDRTEVGGDRTGEWVTLFGERPVVSVEREPVERVRLTTSWTTEEHEVGEQLRRERVELTTTEDPRG